VTVNEHSDVFAGLPVVQFDPGALAPGAPAAAGGRCAWRVSSEYDGEPFDELFARFLDTVDTAAVTHLVFGYWGATYETNKADPVAVLVDAAPRLPNLRAFFLGDIIAEEAEISWIEHGDITPLLRAYPGLERLDVRGSQGLHMTPLSSTALTVLRFESGGLPDTVVRAVGASDLPNLQTLELWLGTREYFGDATVADLAPILGGERLPALTRLGLMNSEIQDDICAAVATAPVVARLSELDLSMGVLTDDGAEALLAGQPLTHLVELDLSHHYCTEPMIARLREALAPVERLLMEAAPRWGDNEDRYVEVAE
jgi:hypothetical protein